LTAELKNIRVGFPLEIFAVHKLELLLPVSASLTGHFLVSRNVKPIKKSAVLWLF